jgi:hypothetical protein
MKSRSSDEVKKVNWDAIDLPSPTRAEIVGDRQIDKSIDKSDAADRQPAIDYDSAISIGTQTLAARIPDMSDADIRYLDRLVWLEISYRIDPSLVPNYRSELGTTDSALVPNQSELGTTDSALVPNQSELGTTDSALVPNRSELGTTDSALVPNQSELGTTDSALVPNQRIESNGFRVPYGCVDYCRVPKGNRDYYYYYWRYYAYADGDEGRERIKKSVYLGSDRQRAQNKIDRLAAR